MLHSRFKGGRCFSCLDNIEENTSDTHYRRLLHDARGKGGREIGKGREGGREGGRREGGRREGGGRERGREEGGGRREGKNTVRKER